MEKITAIVLGAGSRGNVYAKYSKMFPEQLEIVGVAEPDSKRREKFAKEYHIPSEKQFESWEDILKEPKMADAVLLCTMDGMHREPAEQALHLGYHVLLEKPMSNKKEDCIAIERAVRESGKVLTVCHVLRYTPFYQTLKHLVDSGVIGTVAAIDQIENVGYWHQAHSFVRGNWRNEEESSPMILQKSCHDLDIISWLMGKRCLRVSSFGSRQYFAPENRPEGAPKRCLDGCPYQEECLYDVRKIYLNGNKNWPVDVLTTDLSENGIRKALEEGPYGRCVYACDNDVVDRQVVNMEFEGGAVATFTMTAFTAQMTRQLKIMGTNGEIMADMDKNWILLQQFGKESKKIEIPELSEDGFGHGGGDVGIMKQFIKLVHGEGDNVTSAKQSLQSHLMCFAAEESRKNHCVVSIEE